MAKKKSPKKKPPPSLRVRQLPLKWIIPQDIRTLYPTNILVQNDEYEYYVSFFESRPPAIVGTDEEKRALFESTTEIPVICVARLAISKGRMGDFIAVLKENYERRMAMERTASEGSGGAGKKG